MYFKIKGLFFDSVQKTALTKLHFLFLLFVLKIQIFHPLHITVHKVYIPRPLLLEHLYCFYLHESNVTLLLIYLYVLHLNLLYLMLIFFVFALQNLLCHLQ